jgi:putative tricarboxylic transport membrane protein
MNRRNLVRTAAALAVAGVLSAPARAATHLKVLIPANPGGGWDSTGRALGRALQDAKAADSVTFENKGGAAGVIGLTQFVNGSKGDPNALIVMGSVMLGGIIISKSAVSLTAATPIARLTNEYNVFVVPSNSPLRSMADLVAKLKQDPASVTWGGGSRGSTEHIAACSLARDVGVDPRKINYVPFRGGGEAVSAIIGGSVVVGGSGYSEFAEHIASGKMRALGVTSQKRIPGIPVATLKEQGYNVVIGNWRGVYAAPGISSDQRTALVSKIVEATRTKAWTDALQSNRWTSALITDTEFAAFVDYEFSALRAIVYLAGIS